jgi:anti-anti-sigma factor
MFELQLAEGGVVHMKGRLDAAESDRARATLDPIPGPLTLECSQLDYISSAGISVILLTWRRLKAEGETLKLAGLTPHVRNVFTLAALDKVFDIQ